MFGTQHLHRIGCATSGRRAGLEFMLGLGHGLWVCLGLRVFLGIRDWLGLGFWFGLGLGLGLGLWVWLGLGLWFWLGLCWWWLRWWRRWLIHNRRLFGRGRCEKLATEAGGQVKLKGPFERGHVRVCV